MLHNEFLLLIICLTLIVLSIILFLCCNNLISRENNKFRVTSCVAREKKVDELTQTKEGNNGNEKRMFGKVKGESFYVGVNTLEENKDSHNHGESGHFGHHIFGIPNEQEEIGEFIVGKSHILA